MAEPLSALKSRLAGAVLCAFFTAMPAQAENLPDPTRPPAALGANAGDAAVYQGPTVQSIYVSPSRREAVIDGQAVRPGDRFGSETVVGIAENAVVLREGKELRVLRLFPNLTEARAQSAASRRTDEKSHGQNAKN